MRRGCSAGAHRRGAAPRPSPAGKRRGGRRAGCARRYYAAMSDTIIMRGRHLLTDARKKEQGVLKDGAIAIKGDRIAAVGAFQDLERAHPGAKVLGNGRQLLM